MSSIKYLTNAGTSCYGAMLSAIGSWQINLTSVTPSSGPGAGGYYAVHGSLSASMGGGPSGTSSAMLSLAF